MSASKVAFITGANRGIGFETAKALAAQTVHVIVGSRDKSQGEEAVTKIRATGGKADALEFDVKNFAHHHRVAKFIQEKFGKLDILINNAGIMIEADDASVERENRTSTTDMKVLRETFEVNFFAPVALTQTLLPLIKLSPAGRIVNVSSLLASLTLSADPKSMIYDRKIFAYDCSKTALNAFTVHLAQELEGSKIKVNSAEPGWVKTKMGGQSAMLGVEEGAKTSLELALLDENGPTGAFLHAGEAVPW